MKVKVNVTCILSCSNHAVGSFVCSTQLKALYAALDGIMSAVWTMHLDVAENHLICVF